MEFSEIIFMFLNPFEALRGVRSFLEMGGDVLVAIMFATFLLWGLIYERFSFFRNDFKILSENAVTEWNGRSEHKSWYAHQIRTQLVSQARLSAQHNLIYIKVLVALAPFLGLLGTVTGMVEVFDVMAVTGSGNARAMAAGISKATLPTMAGLVTALSGLFFIDRLDRRATNEVQKLEDKLLLAD